MRLSPLSVAAAALLATGLGATSASAAPSDDEDRADITTSVDVVPVRHRTELVETDLLPPGQSAVLVDGIDGLRRRAVATTEIDGELDRTLLLWSRVLRAPVSEVVAVGIDEPPPIVTDPVWDQLAECESGGDWSINTGNGYYGGLQFAASTWSAMGGNGLPHENSREEQIRIATLLRDEDGGYGAWPSCSAQLGLLR